VRLQVSIAGPLFLNGVRDEHKKEVMRLVHEEFCTELQQSDVEQISSNQLDLTLALKAGGQPLVLISSYRLTRSKAPQWVIVTNCDEDFVYLHDSDIDHSQHRQTLDCQHLPVRHKAFDKMCAFGGNKLRASVILYERKDASSGVPTPASAPAR
jgi:hypothetical protein